LIARRALRGKQGLTNSLTGRVGGRRRSGQYLDGMSLGAGSAMYDRVVERRRAVALARHFREAEGLSIAQIADRLGRSSATVKAYFYDPSNANKRPRDSPTR
jgi:DNA-binding NarL/FixJ family response regulator